MATGGYEHKNAWGLASMLTCQYADDNTSSGDSSVHVRIHTLKLDDALLTKPLYDVLLMALLPSAVGGMLSAAVHTAALPVSGQTVSSCPGEPSSIVP